MNRLGFTLVKHKRLCLILFVYLALCGIFFLKFPPVWPDEPIFANPGYNLISQGSLSTNILSNTQIPGIEKYTYWQPPLYFLFLGAVFKLFGFGLIAGRISSIITGAITIFLVYLLAKSIIQRKEAAILCSLLLALNPLFIRASGIMRMDMFTMALILLGLLTYLKSAGNKKLLLLAGLISGAAILTHPLGIIAFICIILHRSLFTRDNASNKAYSILLFATPILLEFALYLFYIMLDPNIFLEQMQMQLARKAHYNLIQGITSAYGFSLIILSSIYLIWKCFASRSQAVILLTIALLISYLISSGSGEMWYIYYFPFTAIALSMLFFDLNNRIKYGWLVYIICICIFAAYATELGTEIKSISSCNYYSFCKEIAQHLPAKGTIYLSSVPDPYFGLLQTTPCLKFIEYSPVTRDTKTIAKVINQADYIIWGPVSGTYSQDRLDYQVIEQIQKSSAKNVLAITAGKYSANVIKIK